ncbi:MAG TPA: hypothetical protein VGK09_08445 [Rhodocyclaceae bacterium]|jgi:hypothetical protein
MTINVQLGLWEIALVILIAIYLVGAVYAGAKSKSLKVSLLWPLFLVAMAFWSGS